MNQKLDSSNETLSRRKAVLAAASTIASGLFVASHSNSEDVAERSKLTDDGGNLPPTPFEFTPFTRPLPIPVVKEPLAVGNPPYEPGNVSHGIAPEYFDRSVAESPELNWFERYPTQYYQMNLRHAFHEFIPGVRTPVVTYDGTVPGPTYRARIGQPKVIRVTNSLDLETSLHLHGGHNPAHSDGYPNFYVLPGGARDYFYTNTVPMLDGVPDFSESPSTMWYHDHAMDLTALTCWTGLAGFYLAYDDLELDLIRSNVLPGDPFDVPVCLFDRRLNADGTLAFDPLDHNGALGDLLLANGETQPFMKVQRRKYRFRFLNGSNARFWELRLSNGQPFIGLGRDSWLFPEAIERETLLLGMANRADVVIDFTDAPSELFLENILLQNDGRGPEGKLDDRAVQIPGVPVMKFIVEDASGPPNATVDVGTPLRPHHAISPAEVVTTREFDFMRRKGAWQINQQFFDPAVANATPQLGTAERWILRNKSGGWWHPIHIHLESHQIQSVDGVPADGADRFKSDCVILGPGTEVEILMKFRTFRGPFVFHCHNLEHEDMRMMFVLDPRVESTVAPQPVERVFP